jgi:hypothetical protein
LAICLTLTSHIVLSYEPPPARGSKDTLKEDWKKTKPKIKAAFKNIKDGVKEAGHSIGESAKKAAKSLKSDDK